MTIDDLVIKPEFENLISKLSKEENAQLEANILADGRVREPIITWGNVIVDGHHRYHILKEHPEITDYKIEDGKFANEHQALAWACANQLGRRNLLPFDRKMLMGKEMSETKLAGGGTGANRYTVLELPQNEGAVKNKKGTSGIIANEHHVGASTVERAEQFYHGIESAKEYDPDIEGKIRSGSIKVPDYVVRDLPKAAPDVRQAAIEAIGKNRPGDAKYYLEHGVTEKPELQPEPEPELEPEPEPEPYNTEDMMGEIDAASRTMIDTLNQILFMSHEDLIADPTGSTMARAVLVDHISRVNEIIERIKMNMEDET